MPAAFTPAPAAARALGGLPPLVVIQAPRGYGKSTTASQWLRRSDLPDHDLVWLAVSPRTTDRDGFWAEVHEELVRVGYSARRHDGDGWEELGRAARERRRHLVIVIDSYERVTDEGVDDELVELAQRHENLHLVLLMRRMRPAVALARAAPEAVVLQAPDLVLGPAQTRTLATGLGLEITPDAAERLCHGLAGWPGLLRVALLTSSSSADGDPVIETSSLAAYLRVVVQDLGSDSLEEVLGALAVPENFTPEVAEALLDAGTIKSAESVLTRMLRAGLIVTVDDGVFAYPPILKEAANQILLEDDPARYWHLNATMARICRREGQAEEALAHAVRSRELALLAEVIEEFWPQLLVADRARLRTALGQLGPRLLAGSPTLVGLRDHVLPAEQPRWFLELLQSDLPVIAPGESTIAVAHDDLEDPGTAAVLVELGMVQLAEADLVAAAFAFHEAVGRSVERRPTVLREAGAGVALCATLLGHLGIGARWIEWVGTQPTARPGPLESVARLAVPATAGLDRLQDVALPDRPPELPEDRRWLESVLVYVWASHALHRGRTVEVLSDLEQYQDRNRHRPVTRLGETLVGASLVDLCIATEQLARGRQTLPPVTPGHPEEGLLRSTRARLALYSGDDEQAMSLTVDVATLAATRPRVALNLSLTRAVAAHRMSQRAAAAEAMHLATRLAERTGILRPFLLVPRSDLDAVAASLPQSRAVLEEVDQAAMSGPFPDPVHVQPLSGREVQVLRELGSGRPLPLMARRLFVSESTVKTQVRSIYRKLGVHSRTEAIERGRLLGLLPSED
ncbi:LuxR C-terminal-related transcriptional regulator [Georgenia subflava]|uniref:HTH luxR-type domain-containing protein n=1 Tax=Georgenia subflava TaxID=1622177 RepID=A0A6N7EHB0_9MICO|nr:LuxR C-terminal-related transcriptional regulator [Georgenia subflava]MPV36533.1 hypothetical protein [Georgenia subflava]